MKNNNVFLDVNKIKTCPGIFEDWDPTSSYCYKIFEKKINWTKAESNCESFGGSLISISSQEISDIINAQTKFKELGHLWIGLSKSSKNQSCYLIIVWLHLNLYICIHKEYI